MMKLYSGTSCPYSHRCRIVLFEKGMDFEVIDVDLMNKSEDLAAINPYNKVPVLVERELVLFQANIINEYIDERFPHPQLMPPDPVLRAHTRLFLHQFEQELYAHVDVIEQGVAKAAEKSRAAIRDNLTQLSPILTKQKFLLSDEFSMLDVAIAPLLWRLDRYGIQLGREAAPMMKYAERLFSRQGFIDALTSSERAMRK
ncbi:MAG: glutathione S-transferase N-terminal domain-containing protein [Gallionella sp.]|jgi:RNA polymerase-associated protein|nr:glutathione S-transferase N-terminal domain-containing protein [Gallionella sp.]MDD4962859.1 glutathione S-transferase N-terminal domain-containing protein [Gallionella sp.]